MTARKICGKKWPAHLCAPGSLHQCTRPVAQLSDRIGHPGNCCCKCGTWHRPDLPGPQPLGIPADVLTAVVETNARLLGRPEDDPEQACQTQRKVTEVTR